MTELWSVVVKEVRQTARDKRVMALLVIAPVLQLIVLGHAVNLDVEHVRAAVADEDRTPQSRRFVSGLLAGDAFDRMLEVESGERARAAVGRGEVTVALVVPRGFAQALDTASAQVQILVDGGDSNRATIAQNAVSAYVQAASLGRARAALAAGAAGQGRALSVASVRVEPRVFYNPTMETRVYFVPGIAATLLLVVTLIVTAMGLAREKEAGTLEQVLVTPIRPTTLIVGKTLPYALVGLVDLALVVVAGAWVFDVPVRGDLLFLFGAGLLFLLTTLGGGMLLSTVSRTQQQAFMGAFFFVMPLILLSGFITPIENMPGWLRPLTALNPVRHFIEILRAVLLKDAVAADLLPQAAALAGLGLTLYGSAIVSLRRGVG